MVLFCFMSILPVNLASKRTLGMVAYLGSTKLPLTELSQNSLLSVNMKGQGSLSGPLTNDSWNCKYSGYIVGIKSLLVE